MTTLAQHNELHVDWTRCDGRGLCTELLPELLARDEWGYPVARRDTDLELRSSEARAAREAVASCPLMALTMRDRASH